MALALIERQGIATSYPMEHFCSWGRKQLGTRSQQEAGPSDELSKNVNKITFLVRIKSVKKTAPNTVNVGTG